MKLINLKTYRYRSLREEELRLENVNLFIGANASGKSTILDALRFLNEGVFERDFKSPVYSRGGVIHLAWKGEEARSIKLVVRFEDNDKTFEWTVRLTKEGYDFSVREDLIEIREGEPPTSLLSVEKGKGWWWSGEEGRVTLDQPPTICALAAAAVDASFPARSVAEFVSRWGFFDPSPFLLRRGWTGLDSSRFDPHGRNLAERLFQIKETSPDAFNQVVAATQSVLGLPSRIEIREARESEDRFYFVQHEPGLRYPVHQIGASSGTLRMLALMIALFGEAETNLIGIEEPENHIHPTALAAFAEYVLKACDRVQILLTTHSPMLLDSLGDPESVCIVRHSNEEGTRVSRQRNVQDIHRALEASGFGLGEFFETTGFGG